jgi:chemotaxis protein MotB
MKKYFGLLFLTAIIACVPQRKFLDEKAKRETCEKELANYKSSSQTLETQTAELKNKIAEDEKRLVGLKKDTAIIGTNYRNLTSKYDKLNEVNENLIEKFNKLLSGSNSESQKLSGQLSATQEQLQRKEDDLKKLSSELDQKKIELDQKKKDLDLTTAELKKREERVKELEDVLKKKDEAVNALKKKVSDALLGFEGKGLTITQKNGKVYVSLDESLLFATGKWTVEAKGVEVLKKLAKVLEANTDINVLVEGHTDDVPMKGLGDVKDNWDLSAVRATSVVKIITQNSSTDSKRLTAANIFRWMKPRRKKGGHGTAARRLFLRRNWMSC